jgi:hypothetical protein
MTTLTLAPAPAAVVSDVAQVPAWFAPTRRQDPLFPMLLRMDLTEIEVALLASGAPYAAMDPQRLTIDQAAGLVLNGLRRIGLAEVRYIGTEWRRINRRFLALPSSRENNRAWDLALADVRGGHLRGTRRQRAAIDTAYYLSRSGIRHDRPDNLIEDTGRCLARDCRHCYPQHPVTEVA